MNDPKDRLSEIQARNASRNAAGVYHHAPADIDWLLQQVRELEDDAGLGKRWKQDSSLETWFPLTAEQLAQLRNELNDARALIAENLKSCREHIAKIAELKPRIDQLIKERDDARAQLEASEEGRQYNQAKLEEARAQLEKVKDDAKRLDWLEQKRFIKSVANKSQDAIVFATTIALPGENLRDAIDKAILAELEQKKAI